MLGSSPLTRGKQFALPAQLCGERLIPAHAGKTLRMMPRLSGVPAHPRSRGENVGGAGFGTRVAGSSPLTRGKRKPAPRLGEPPRLIPAHAGKTVTITPPVSRRGSSPLTRGKPPDDSTITRPRGLIPAHAGKTRPSTPSMRGRSAHPRSRGENVGRLRLRAVAYGSSPLTRGKPHLHCR